LPFVSTNRTGKLHSAHPGDKRAELRGNRLVGDRLGDGLVLVALDRERLTLDRVGRDPLVGGLEQVGDLLLGRGLPRGELAVLLADCPAELRLPGG
jgi:hypothetical protein